MRLDSSAYTKLLDCHVNRDRRWSRGGGAVIYGGGVSTVYDEIWIYQVRLYIHRVHKRGSMPNAAELDGNS